MNIMQLPQSVTEKKIDWDDMKILNLFDKMSCLVQGIIMAMAYWYDLVE